MKTILHFLTGLLKFYRGNPAGIIGSSIVALIVAACLAAPILAENDPKKRVARGHQPPSAELVFGSTRAGKDVYSQVLHGGRVSLFVAFSAATVTTVIALGIPSIFGGAIITEQVFKVNGIGQLLIGAIQANDLPMVQTLTFIFAFLIVFFNLIADILYGILDPRIRYD